MEPLILLVEDNLDLLYNLKLTLEQNGYKVLTAENGVQALEILQRQDHTPDLIISDILMPKLNGYEFFRAISSDKRWSQIPFIFLSALSSPREVRLGKLLGADDYITKPFYQADLLASISGKLRRNQNRLLIYKEIEKFFKTLDKTSPIRPEATASVPTLLYVTWSDSKGPVLENYYPINNCLPISIDQVGFQLFNGMVSVYGTEKVREPVGILLNIQNLKQDGYIFYDSIIDEAVRGGIRPFMLAILSSRITYFNSLKIKAIFLEISAILKARRSLDVFGTWKSICEVIPSSSLASET